MTKITKRIHQLFTRRDPDLHNVFVANYPNFRIYFRKLPDSHPPEDVIIKYNNGDIYFGYVDNLQRHGKGLLIQADGRRYRGDWVENKPQGQGTFISSDKKNEYVGGWHEGQYQGFGTLTNKTIDYQYTGGWKMGKKSGHGRETYGKSKCGYVGGWENDQRNGHGLETDCWGFTYKGIFRDDDFRNGTINYPYNRAEYGPDAGGTYTGEALKYMRHGYGEMVYPYGKPPRIGLWHYGMPIK